jgi:hypothetical protein
MKERLFLRIPAELRQKIDARVGRGDTTITQLMERYIRDGLARDAGELIEESSLPAVSQAVRLEVNKSIGDLYDRLSADLQRSARRSDDRLAALIIKAARGAGIAQRLLYSLMAKTVNVDFAKQMYEVANEQAGKELARSGDQQKAQKDGKGQ